ncbi:XdhC family protein [Cellulomonas sp. URHB0016]
MLEIAARVLARLDAGATVVVVTVVGVDGSAPRALGTSMAWDGEQVVGSLAGGCVEGAVLDVADRVLDDGRARTVEMGVGDPDGLVAGLACGGRVRVHLARVTPDDAVVPALRRAAAGRAAGVALVLGGASALMQPRLDALVAARVATGTAGLVTVDCDGVRVEVFVDVAAVPARFVVVGATEEAAALAAAARPMGYAVSVVDPRPVFATPTRFPEADVVVAWPPSYLADAGLDGRAVVCLLSHDDRFDAETLAVALRSPAGYVGAMGSRRTHARRVAALGSLGLDDGTIARLHSPIGLDVGASTPAETAVAILAEVVAARTGRSGTALRELSGPLHAQVQGA